jgi:GDP-mannose 6-dehydrogenase
VQTARLTGANRAYIDREIPHLERLLAPTPQAALEGAGLVIVGHVGAEDRPALRAALAGKRVIDLAGMPDLAEIPGVAYQGFCW